MSRTLEITAHQQRILASYARHEVGRDEASEMLQVSTKTILRWFKHLGLEYAAHESHSKVTQARRRALAQSLDRDNVMEVLLYQGDEQSAVANRFGLTRMTVRKFTQAFNYALLNPATELPKSEWKVEDWAQHAVVRLAAKYPDTHPAVVKLAKNAAKTDNFD